MFGYSKHALSFPRFAFASLLVAVLAVGCMTSAAAPATVNTAAACDGSLLRSGEHQYCVHKGIIVTGFRCPPNMARRIEVPASATTVAATVCTADLEATAAQLQSVLESEDPSAVVCFGQHNGSASTVTLVHQPSLCESAWTITTPLMTLRFSQRPHVGSYSLSRPDEWNCQESGSIVAAVPSDGTTTRSAGIYYPGTVVITEVSAERIAGEYRAWQGYSATGGSFSITGDCQSLTCNGVVCRDGELCVSRDGGAPSCQTPTRDYCDEVACPALGCANGARVEGNQYVCLTDAWQPAQHTH